MASLVIKLPRFFVYDRSFRSQLRDLPRGKTALVTRPRLDEEKGAPETEMDGACR
jgi:hypothetical protein